MHLNIVCSACNSDCEFISFYFRCKIACFCQQGLSGAAAITIDWQGIKFYCYYHLRSLLVALKNLRATSSLRRVYQGVNKSYVYLCAAVLSALQRRAATSSNNNTNIANVSDGISAVSAATLPADNHTNSISWNMSNGDTTADADSAELILTDDHTDSERSSSATSVATQPLPVTATASSSSQQIACSSCLARPAEVMCTSTLYLDFHGCFGRYRIAIWNKGLLILYQSLSLSLILCMIRYIVNVNFSLIILTPF